MSMRSVTLKKCQHIWYQSYFSVYISQGFSYLRVFFNNNFKSICLQGCCYLSFLHFLVFSETCRFSVSVRFLETSPWSLCSTPTTCSPIPTTYILTTRSTSARILLPACEYICKPLHPDNRSTSARIPLRACAYICKPLHPAYPLNICQDPTASLCVYM